MSQENPTILSMVVGIFLKNRKENFMNKILIGSAVLIIILGGYALASYAGEPGFEEAPQKLTLQEAPVIESPAIPDDGWMVEVPQKVDVVTNPADIDVSQPISVNVRPDVQVRSEPVTIVTKPDIKIIIFSIISHKIIMKINMHIMLR